MPLTNTSLDILLVETLIWKLNKFETTSNGTEPTGLATEAISIVLDIDQHPLVIRAKTMDTVEQLYSGTLLLEWTINEWSSYQLLDINTPTSKVTLSVRPTISPTKRLKGRFKLITQDTPIVLEEFEINILDPY